MIDHLGIYIRIFAFQTPLVLVCLAGLTAGILKSKEHRASSILVIVGSVLMLLTSRALPILTQIVLQAYSSQRRTTDQFKSVLEMLGVIRTVTFSIGLALVLVVVLTGRSTQVSRCDHSRAC